MALEFLKIRRHSTGKVTYANYANDQERAIAGNQRGEGIWVPSYQNAVEEGTVFTALVGAATTPISFAKTAYDADQPQFVVDVPSGTTIRPLSLKVILEDAAGTDTEIIQSFANANMGAGTSTAVTSADLLFNMRAQAAGTDPATACSVYSLYTGNGSLTSGMREFWRHTAQFAQEADDADANDGIWGILKGDIGPVIEGTGSWVVHIDGTTTAPAGFLIATWWEYTT